MDILSFIHYHNSCLIYVVCNQIRIHTNSYDYQGQQYHCQHTIPVRAMWFIITCWLSKVQLMNYTQIINQLYKANRQNQNY